MTRPAWGVVPRPALFMGRDPQGLRLRGWVPPIMDLPRFVSVHEPDTARL